MRTYLATARISLFVVTLCWSAAIAPAQEAPPNTAAILDPLTPREQAQNYLENDEARKAVATLVEAARKDPSDRTIGAMIYGSIRDHVWHIPQTLPISHSSAVRLLTFSPDGTRLASGTEGGEVVVSTTEPLDEPDARELRVTFKLQGAIRGLFFTSDSRRLAAVPSSGGLKVWDMETRGAVFELADFGSPVTTVATNRQSNLVAIGTEAGPVIVVDVAAGKQLWRLEPQAAVTNIAITVDGTRLAVATADRMVTVWDLATGKPAGGAMRRAATIASLSFGADGRSLLIADSPGTAALVNPGTMLTLCPAIDAGAAIKKAQVSPDGTRIALLLDDGTVRFWDAQTGKVLPYDVREDGQFHDMLWSRTGLRMATASEGNHATVWSTRDGERWGEALPHEAPVLALAYSPDGKLLATGCRDGKARIWRMDGGKAMPTVRSHSARARTAFYSLDGDHLITTSEDHTALHWISGQVRPFGPALKHAGKVTCGVFDAEVTRILTSDDTGIAQLWSADTGKAEGAPYRHKSAVKWVDFHPDGHRFVAASGAGAYVWSVTNREKPLAVIMHPGGEKSELKCARFSPDGKWLATASTDGTARIWDAATYQPVGAPIARNFPVLCVRFSPDNSRLVVAGEDAQAAVYDTATWKVAGTPVLLPGPVFSAAITEDNRFLVVTSFLLNAVQFFEVATGQALGRAPNIPTQATCVDYHLQDSVVTVACDDGTVRAFGSPFVLQNVPGWACKFAERLAGYRKTGPETFERVESHYGQFANYLSGGARAGNASFAKLIRWKMTVGTGRTGMPRFVSTIAANVERRLEERSLDALYECYEAAPGYPLVLAALSAYLPPGKQSEFLADTVIHDPKAEPLSRAFATTALLNAKRTEEAKQVITQALADAPGELGVLRRAAKFEARQKNKEQSIALFEKAVTLSPDDAETRRSYGWALYNLGEPAKAAAQFRSAQDLTGDMNPDLMAGLCLSLAASNNSRDATTIFRRMVLFDASWKDASFIASLNGWTARELQALETVRKATFPTRR